MTRRDEPSASSDRSLTDRFDAAGLDRRSILRSIGTTALVGGLAKVAAGRPDADGECKSVVAALAAEDGTIGDAELQRGIKHWRRRTDVPGTCGETVEDATLLELVELWRSGEPVESEDPRNSLDEVVYVDATDGSADGTGTEDDPFATIQAGMDRATELKNEGRSVYVDVAAGTYREAVEFAYSNYDGGGTDVAVRVDGAGPESTLIKGSEVFDGWQSEGDNRYSHEWPYDWGVADDPTGGFITDCEAHPEFCADTPDLVLRREMVFVDGDRLRQVLSADAMGPGTYFVDESADRLYLEPPTDVTLADATVEVGIRPKGWFTQSENNVTISNLGVEHVATPWTNGKAGMVIDGSNISVENVRVVENNFVGLSVRGDGHTIRDCTLDRNGADGLGAYKVKDLLVEGCSVDANNWRGGLGGYTGWSVGNKFFKGHGIEIRETSFNDNQSRGLWFDNDLKNVLLEDVELRNNLRENFFLEQLQGPVTLRRVVSADSGGYGLTIGNAEDTTIENSRLVNNRKGSIHLGGREDGRTFQNFETGETLTTYTEGLSIYDSVLSGVGGSVQAGNSNDGRYLIGTVLYDTWEAFLDSYEGDRNVWYEAERRDAFEWPGNELVDLEEWQARTGEEQDSVWKPPSEADLSGP